MYQSGHSVADGVIILAAQGDTTQIYRNQLSDGIFVKKKKNLLSDGIVVGV